MNTSWFLSNVICTGHTAWPEVLGCKRRPVFESVRCFVFPYKQLVSNIEFDDINSSNIQFRVIFKTVESLEIIVSISSFQSLSVAARSNGWLHYYSLEEEFHRVAQAGDCLLEVSSTDIRIGRPKLLYSSNLETLK